MSKRPPIYLDFAATTPLDPEVLEAMLPFLTDAFGNPSSVHAVGRQARGAVEAARDAVADLLGASPPEIVFTGGGTEANNLALLGTLGRGDLLVTSRVEHESVLRSGERLSRRGCEVRYVKAQPDGTIDSGVLAGVLTLANRNEPKTLVSLMHVNNEIGSLNDIRRLAETAHQAGAVMHTDAVQSVGLLDINVADLGVDLLSLSGHKMYGPKGSGVLFVRSGHTVQSQSVGGPQERSRRAGTENVAAIVGLSKALELAVRRRGERCRRIVRLRDRLIQKLVDVLGHEIVLNNPVEAGRLSPHIVNVSVRSDEDHPVDGEMLLLNLDIEGVYASSGSACSSGTVHPSHVLEAIGRSPNEAAAAVRFSLGDSTTEADIDYAVSCLGSILRRMRETARRRGNPA